MKQFISAIIVLANILLAVPAYSQHVNPLLEYERNTIEVFQKASPKVVYVHRLKAIKQQAEGSVAVPTGAGSGIIWDNAGHVVTNYHVVQGAEMLAVSIGEDTYAAKVVGVEPRKDIAVLSLAPSAKKALKKFSPFEIAHSRDLVVGQKAIAIGNPFGLDHSLTIGVISALGREVPGAGGVAIHDMIQTDASINPGNSGGPLLDSSGRLLGFNTTIYSQSGTSAGVGFAVPADEVSRIVGQIIQNGRVKLAGLGIQRIEPKTAARYGVEEGILVSKVFPGTPAARAGIQGTKRGNWGKMHLGDVIVAIDGKEVPDYDSFYDVLSKVNIGDAVKVSLVRNGKRFQRSIKTIDIASY